MAFRGDDCICLFDLFLAFGVGEQLIADRAGVILDVAFLGTGRFLRFRLGQRMSLRGDDRICLFDLFLAFGIGEQLSAGRAGVILDVARFRAGGFLCFRLGQRMLARRGNGLESDRAAEFAGILGITLLHAGRFLQYLRQLIVADGELYLLGEVYPENAYGIPDRVLARFRRGEFTVFHSGARAVVQAVPDVGDGLRLLLRGARPCDGGENDLRARLHAVERFVIFQRQRGDLLALRIEGRFPTQFLLRKGDRFSPRLHVVYHEHGVRRDFDGDRIAVLKRDLRQVVIQLVFRLFGDGGKSFGIVAERRHDRSRTAAVERDDVEHVALPFEAQQPGRAFLRIVPTPFERLELREPVVAHPAELRDVVARAGAHAAVHGVGSSAAVGDAHERLCGNAFPARIVIADICRRLVCARPYDLEAVIRVADFRDGEHDFGGVVPVFAGNSPFDGGIAAEHTGKADRIRLVRIELVGRDQQTRLPDRRALFFGRGLCKIGVAADDIARGSLHRRPVDGNEIGGRRLLKYEVVAHFERYFLRNIQLAVAERCGIAHRISACDRRRQFGSGRICDGELLPFSAADAVRDVLHRLRLGGSL